MRRPAKQLLKKGENHVAARRFGQIQRAIANQYYVKKATQTGLEPATSGSTVRDSNQLSYCASNAEVENYPEFKLYASRNVIFGKIHFEIQEMPELRCNTERPQSRSSKHFPHPTRIQP